VLRPDVTGDYNRENEIDGLVPVAGAALGCLRAPVLKATS